MAQTISLAIGDVAIRFLTDELGCIETLTVLANETFTLGEVGGLNSAGKVVQVATLADDVYTLTEATGTDGGTFGLRYRGDETAALAWDITNANLQIALRALHADLDACVCAGSQGGPYTVTVDNSKKSDIFHLSKGFDFTEDDGVLEGGITVDRTTYGEHPSVIALEAVEDSSDASAIFLVRNAIVDVANLTGGAADVYVRLAEPKVADDWENCAGYGNILARTGPTYTYLATT